MCSCVERECMAWFAQTLAPRPCHPPRSAMLFNACDKCCGERDWGMEVQAGQQWVKCTMALVW